MGFGKVLVGLLFTAVVAYRIFAVTIADVPLIGGCKLDAEKCEIANPLCLCEVRNQIQALGVLDNKLIKTYLKSDPILSKKDVR